MGKSPSKIEMWPVTRPQPYPGNPRANEEAVAAVAASIKAFGFRQPLVVDAHDIIIAGHTRLKAAVKLGLKRVPVLVAADLTPEQVRAYRIADNRTAEFSTWDFELLVPELEALGADLKLELAELDLDGLLAEAEAAQGPRAGLTDADDVPEPPVEPVTKRGDLWLCGGEKGHRVLCGDSTDAADVKRLMGGERAGLMNTDPPYGVAYANDERPNPGVAKPRVANDTLQDEKLQAFLEAAFTAAKDEALNIDAAWYLWHAHLTQGFFAAAAAAAAAVILHRQIIWVKPVLLLGRGQYHWKHEPCFFGWVKGHQPPDYGEGKGERTQTTVWNIGSVTQAERREFNHSAPKPVGLFTVPIVKHLKTGEICYEPFAGSGPQMIAAEMLGRRAFMCEIEPRYVDVCVKRWEQFTGHQPVLESTGQTLDEVKRERSSHA